jgi:cytochrome c553
MVPSARNHIYRLALLLVVAIAGLLWIKGWFVPAGWDTQNWYRSGALEDLRQQATVYGSNSICMTACHDKTRKNHAAIGAMMASSVHHGLSCESCHGPLHEGEHKTAAAQVARDSRLCLRCHDAVAARPRQVGLFSESFMAHQTLDVKKDGNCMQCHDPHSPRPKQVAVKGESKAWLPSVLAVTEGCDSCHKPGVPFMPLIAGQPEAYLRTVMLQQRDGSRKSFVMGDLLKGYSNEKVATLSRYYASAGWTSANEETDPDLVKAGEALHQRGCAGCHGEDGRAASGMAPRLAGQSMSYLKAQLKAYLDPKTRLPNEVMRTIVRGLSAKDVDALAHYYAAEPVTRVQAADLNAVIAGCNSCHRPGFSDMPLIAGQPEEYLRVVMLQHRDGSRSAKVMGDILENYSDQRIRELARSYARSGWVSAKQKVDPGLIKEGAVLHQSRCAGCHGPDGSKAEGMTPRLAGQPVGYTETQLRSFQDQGMKLPNEMMRTLAKGLSAHDIRALAHFYAANSPAPAPKPPAEAAAPAAVNVDVSALTPGCDDCHHPGGKPRMPLIAGQPEEYLRAIMREQRDGVRDAPLMADLLKGHTDQQIDALASHYARQKWAPAPAKIDEATVKAGAAVHKERCAGCHGPRGLKAEGMTPRLAGQNAAFLEEELKRYRDPGVKRPHALMRSLAQMLKPDQAKALAGYYAAQSD